MKIDMFITQSTINKSFLSVHHNCCSPVNNRTFSSTTPALQWSVRLVMGIEQRLKHSLNNSVSDFIAVRFNKII